jgi:ubiquitin-conjugating enzyme E2 variant
MGTPPARLRPRDASSLAKGYTRAVRRWEILGLWTYAAGVIAWAISLAPRWWDDPWVLLSAVASGYIAADLVSGLVHWAADSWLSADLPILGPAFLRPFREHHVDPEAITRHDFVETNGNNALVSVPGIVAAVLMPSSSPLALFCTSFVGALTLWLMATNQFHKWAHLRRPSGLLAFLQRVHLILPPQHHVIHHTAPYDRYYCITTGWLNATLTWVRFFPLLEWMVSGVTGWVPRQDDLGEYTAQSLVRERESEKLSSNTLQGRVKP